MTYKIADRKYVETPLAQLEEETFNTLLALSGVDQKLNKVLGIDDTKIVNEIRVLAKQLSKNYYRNQKET